VATLGQLFKIKELFENGSITLDVYKKILTGMFSGTITHNWQINELINNGTKDEKDNKT